MITRTEGIVGAAEFYSRLATALKSSNAEAFLFIHGYNVTFEDAVFRTAQLFHDLEFDGVPILFTWPAQDAWWRYLAAEEQAQVAVRHLQEFITGIATTSKPTAVNVIAHSMGNRVLANALDRLILIPEMQKTAAFNNLVLAAPDVSLDNFNGVAEAVKAASRRVVYASGSDVPLFVSKQLHRFARVGEAPPDRIPTGIDAVDASAVTRDMLGHSYFSHSSSIQTCFCY